jgi:hypothetical protein|tara:strand:- start:588 stop:968 length:381 start_codon:yes stop_codon:yes gene_type:complete
MNFEKHIKEISYSNVNSLDENIFLENLHSERRRRDLKNNRILNGLSAGMLVILFSWVTFSQLTDNPMIYASNDLKPMEIMDIETETYVYELADYLVESSDDIWETLAFLDEMNFETIALKNNRGLE